MFATHTNFSKLFVSRKIQYLNTYCYFYVSTAPDFVTSVEDGDYVYFFFREQAVEYINCGKVLIYRIEYIRTKKISLKK